MLRSKRNMPSKFLLRIRNEIKNVKIQLSESKKGIYYI